MTARILVVDDEKGMRDFLVWELESLGHRVLAFADGAEAVAAFEREAFDVVISDIRMPGMTGLELLRALRSVVPDAEVIMSTGHATLETAIECLRYGACDILQKPFHAAELIASVERALEHARLKRATSLYEASVVIFSAPMDGTLPQRIVDVAKVVMDADEAKLEPAVSPGGEDGDSGARLVQAERSTIIIPLVLASRPIAVLTMHRNADKRRFRQDDVERANVLASQMLLALQNQKLASQMMASERLATIGQLAAGVAHEINNPLVYVSASLEFMKSNVSQLAAKDGNVDQDIVAEMARAIDDGIFGAARIADIARDMKALAKTDEGIAPKRASLAEVVRAAIRVSGAEIKQRAVLIEQLDADVDVLVNPGRLSQVFINLIVNAAQAIAEHRCERREITVRAFRDGDRAIAQVIDTGPGIKPEHRARLFEAFFTTKGASVGTGLGLWLSRDIVRRFGGTMRVESEVGAGTTFTVDLPLAAASERTSSLHQATS